MNPSFNLRGDLPAKILRWIHGRSPQSDFRTPKKHAQKRPQKNHTCTKEHLNGMVKKWPFYGVFCDLQLGDEKVTLESPGHQMFVLLCLQNQKTVALLPKSLLLDPRFPVFLQGFLASYPPWWNQNCQRQTSKKSAKSGEISPTRKDGAKNLSFCYMDKLPFFCSVHSPRNFETCHQTGCSNPRFKNKASFKKTRWLIIFFFGALWGDGQKPPPKKGHIEKKTA